MRNAKERDERFSVTPDHQCVYRSVPFPVSLETGTGNGNADALAEIPGRRFTSALSPSPNPRPPSPHLNTTPDRPNPIGVDSIRTNAARPLSADPSLNDLFGVRDDGY